MIIIEHDGYYGGIAIKKNNETFNLCFINFIQTVVLDIAAQLGIAIHHDYQVAIQ